MLHISLEQWPTEKDPRTLACSSVALSWAFVDIDSPHTQNLVSKERREKPATVRARDGQHQHYLYKLTESEEELKVFTCTKNYVMHWYKLVLLTVANLARAGVMVNLVGVLEAARV